MCPKCKNEFIAVENLEALEVRDERQCPICHNHYVLALLGEQKIDNTIYTINFDNRDFYSTKEKLRKRLNAELFNVEEIMPESEHKIMTSIIYRGDVLHAFWFMNALTGGAICYTITPEFPFERCIYPDIALCPTCGTPTVEKTESESTGFYCEKCNEWVLRGYL